jgi:HAD superfamily hydrolase (TIGR01509 family)
VIKALIFDFDGLILETEGPTFQAWQEVFEEHGGSLPLEKWATIIGTSNNWFDPFGELEAQLGRPVDRPTIESRRKLREQALILAQPIQPGVQDTLHAARRLGLKVGLASSSSSRWIEEHLKRLGLRGDFDCLRTRDDVAHTKPDPELYLSVLQAFALPGEQAIALEDSPNGVLAARRAGLFCVAIPNELTRHLPLEHANLQINSLADWPLERLLNEASQNGRARPPGTPS